MSQKVSLTLAELTGIRNLYRAAWPYATKTIAKLDRAIQREDEAQPASPDDLQAIRVRSAQLVAQLNVPLESRAV